MRCEWGEQYSFDDVIIDAEHRELLAILNDLQEGSRDEAELIDLLARLLLHAGSHFCSEEDLMRSRGYPGTIQHTDAHRAFEETVQNYAGTLQSGTPVQFCEVAGYLEAWVEGHFLHDDMALREFVQSHAAACAGGGPAW